MITQNPSVIGFKRFAIPLFALFLSTMLQAQVWQESGGLVIIETESTTSPLGQWIAKTSVSGYTGPNYLEFNGNTTTSGPPNSPLEYKFRITKPGLYYIHLHCAKETVDGRTDVANDAYIRVEGDYNAGPNVGDTHGDDAPLDKLKTDTKFFGGKANEFVWASGNRLDLGGHTNKRVAVYDFKSGETYKLVMSGRSKLFKVNRIVFRRTDVGIAKAEKLTLPESEKQVTSGNPLVYDATTDFSETAGGEVPYYVDATRNALAIDASVIANRGKFARATTTFTGTPGTYDVTIRALQETDGECSVRLLLNGAVLGNSTNNRTSVDYTPQDHTFPGITIPAGATLGVETNSASNGLIPENSGFAYARGRWTTLTLAESSSGAAPVANAGADQTLTLPDNVAFFPGSATDADGTVVSYAWTQLSGPDTADLNGANTTELAAGNLSTGTYTFRLTVTDNDGNTGSDDVSVAVLPDGGSFATVLSFTLLDANTDQPIPGFNPIVDGAVINKASLGISDFNVRIDTEPNNDFGRIEASLRGATTEDRIENAYPWALFGDTNGDFRPGVLNDGAHTLTATPYSQDGTGGDVGTPLTIRFNVTSATGIPVADAGPDQSVLLPTNSVTLVGSGTDEGSIASYAWSQVSGPASASLSGANSANLTAEGLVQGVYVFRLTVTDDQSNTASDSVSVSVGTAGSGNVSLSGEAKRWHKLNLTLDGPTASETGTPNPFADYRMTVVFTHPATGLTYSVPGYFAADGNAADTSAKSGNKWRAHLSPDEIGTWTYTISFRSGTDVAVDPSPGAGAAVSPYDGTTGYFVVSETDKSGRDLRGKGRLEYVGKHHLRFAGSGEYFIKAGADSPENLLAYDDFDDTPNDRKNQPNLRKSWSPHATDYDVADAAEYTWSGGKGTELLGAVAYLASEGLNAFSFLTFSLDGDDDNVFPHLLKSTVAGYEGVADNARWANVDNGVHHDRFDVSKMEQWERIFAYGDKKGMYLHFKTQETENNQKMDGGELGRERKLYYRELVARYGHHLALNWNLGEENTNTVAQRKAFAQYFAGTDPYRHNIVIHSYASDIQQDGVYTPLLGNNSALTGTSLQTNEADFSRVFGSVLRWVTESANAGKPWVVACDEPGDAVAAIRPDNDAGNSHVDGRKNALWGTVMAGGAGAEFYFGYQYPDSDLTLQDFRSRDAWWDYCRYLLGFFNDHRVPFQDMSNADTLSSNPNSWCLAKPGDSYVVYLKDGGTTNLDLSGVSGTFTVCWFDPRNGGVLQKGSVGEVTAGGTVSIGDPPAAPGQDWAVLVNQPKRLAYIYGDVSEDGDVPSGSKVPYDQMLLDDTGTTGLSMFGTLVEDQGLRIDGYYDQATTLNAAFLNQFDAIIFGLHQKVWSDSEKAALDTWLRAGGGMLIYSDSAAGGKFNIVGAQNPVGQTAVNNLISQYGLEVTVDQANGVKAYRAGSDSIHPIISDRLIFEGEGVSPVAIDPSGPGYALIPYRDDPENKVSGNPDIPNKQNLTTANPQFAALAWAFVGEGNVIASFDRQPMWNDGPGSDIGERDNAEILRRIVRFIAGVDDFSGFDRDNDGISDRDETSFDTDGDGIPNHSDLDSDGDGNSDAAEVMLGLNPYDVSENFISTITPGAVGELEISWPSNPGNLFRIRANESLSGPVGTWQIYKDNILASPGNITKSTIRIQGDKNFFSVELK